MTLITRGLLGPLIITNGLGSGAVIVGPATIRAAVAYKLKNASAVAALVGTRVYPIQPPASWQAGRDGPCVTYQVITRTFGQSLDAEDGTSLARVRIVATAETAAASLAVAEAVRADWLAYTGTVGTVSIDEVDMDGQDVDPLDPGDGSDRRAWTVTTTYQVMHRTS